MSYFPVMCGYIKCVSPVWIVCVFGSCVSSGEEQIFNITMAKIEAMIKPDCILDDFRWEAASFILF